MAGYVNVNNYIHGSSVWEIHLFRDLFHYSQCPVICESLTVLLVWKYFKISLFSQHVLQSENKQSNIYWIVQKAYIIWLLCFLINDNLLVFLLLVTDIISALFTILFLFTSYMFYTFIMLSHLVLGIKVWF